MEKAAKAVVALKMMSGVAVAVAATGMAVAVAVGASVAEVVEEARLEDAGWSRRKSRFLA